jgi:hypothetical protein
MKTNLLRVLALTAFAAATVSAQQVDEAQASARRNSGGMSIVGVWDVAVTVVACDTGALIRNVHSVQMYQPDGAFTETTNSGLRGSSVGYWYHEQGQNFGAGYFFFRYAADGTPTSFAKAANNITLSLDGSQFTVTATIQDYDANNKLISTGCVTQTAKRL